MLNWESVPQNARVASVAGVYVQVAVATYVQTYMHAWSVPGMTAPVESMCAVIWSGLALPCSLCVHTVVRTYIGLGCNTSDRGECKNAN